MLKVTIELISAVTGRTTEIGRMYLANDGKASRHDPQRGDYNVAVCRRGTTTVPRELWDHDEPHTSNAARSGRVENYPRLKHNVWRLIARALHVAFPEESKPAKRKAGDRPVLSLEVMEGLQLLSDHASAPPGTRPDEIDRINVAREWLDAANLRKD